MRKRYAASFFLGSQGVPGPELEDVSELCLQWVDSNNHVENLRDTEVQVGGTCPKTSLGAGVSLETSRITNDDMDYWGLRLDHLDTSDEDMLWRTEVCISRNSDTEQTAFSCQNFAGSVSQNLVPNTRSISRPRIVRDVLRRWDGYKGGYSLYGRPRFITPDESEGFTKALMSASRQRPVIFVSTKNDNDAEIIDPRKLADWLSGLAHVVVAENRFVSRRMQDLLPEKFQCWNGAIRIYWPEISLNDPYSHKLWLPERIREIESYHKHGFTEFLLSMISNISISVDDPEIPSWGLLEYFRRQRQIDQAKAEGKLDEWVNLLEEENAQLKSDNEEFQLRIWDQEKQVKREVADSLRWREACFEAQKQASVGINEPSIVAPPESAAEAIARAKSDFSDRLVFAFNSKSDGENSAFSRAEDLLAAFEFLATTYFDSKTGRVSCDDLDGALRNHNGWRFEANQSRTAMGKYPAWYRTRYGKTTYSLEEHFKTGSSKDSRHTIRVAFAWDAELSKVIVGFLGQHQRTDAT